MSLVTVFQSSFVTTLATAGTTLLSLSFVFAVTTQEFLGSCIFLFVKHPYDVGDRVDIQGPDAKQQLVVEKISLLFTVFTRIDRMQVVQVPNIALNNLWIENVTRSKAMKEIIDINVSYDTSFEDLELLRGEMEKFVRLPENARDFQPDVLITVAGCGDLDKLMLKVYIKHKSNWHNESVRAARRSKFMCALTLALKRIPIYNPGGGGEALGGPTNPTYSVSVDDQYAIEARTKADEAKAAGRMVPPNPVRSDSTSNQHDVDHVEAKAAEHLNTRDPLQDMVEDWGYDQTLNSRDASAERKRSHDIETIRSDLKLTRETTRGRRKPGEALPPTPLGENVPGVSLSQYQSNRTRSFDVEAGLPQSSNMQPQQSSVIGQHVYGGVSQPGNPANAGYSVYPTGSNPYFSPASSSSNAPLPTVPEPSPFPPLQMPPSGSTAASGSSGVTGTRQRGASISRPQAQQGQAPPVPGTAPGKPAGF
jgi:hypothetical protein